MHFWAWAKHSISLWSCQCLFQLRSRGPNQNKAAKRMLTARSNISTRMSSGKYWRLDSTATFGSLPTPTIVFSVLRGWNTFERKCIFQGDEHIRKKEGVSHRNTQLLQLWKKSLRPFFVAAASKSPPDTIWETFFLMEVDEIPHIIFIIIVQSAGDQPKHFEDAPTSQTKVTTPSIMLNQGCQLFLANYTWLDTSWIGKLMSILLFCGCQFHFWPW